MNINIDEVWNGDEGQRIFAGWFKLSLRNIEESGPASQILIRDACLMNRTTLLPPNVTLADLGVSEEEWKNGLYEQFINSDPFLLFVFDEMSVHRIEETAPILIHISHNVTVTGQVLLRRRREIMDTRQTIKEVMGEDELRPHDRRLKLGEETIKFVMYNIALYGGEHLNSAYILIIKVIISYAGYEIVKEKIS